MSKRKASISVEELTNGDESPTIIKQEPVTPVKQEPFAKAPIVGLNEDAEKVLNLLQSHGTAGVSDDVIAKCYPELGPQDRVAIINKLVAAGKVGIFNQKGVLVYKAKDPAEGTQIKGSNVEEKTVFTIVKEAGNKGIWIRDIRLKSNLIQTQLNKVLKSLEGKSHE